MPPGLGLGLGSLGSAQGGVGGYSAEAEAYFAAMTTQPDALSASIYDNTIKTLISASLWDKIEKLWFFASHDTVANAGLEARRDVKNPLLTATRNNSPVYQQFRGFSSVSVGSSYLKSGFNPGDGGAHIFTQNDAGFGVYCLTDAAVNNGFEIGEWSSITFNNLNPRDATDKIEASINSGKTNAFASASASGFFAMWRKGTGANNAFYQINNSVSTWSSNVSAAPKNVEWWLCGANGGVLTGRQIAFAFVSKYLTESEAQALYTIIKNQYIDPMIAR